jgi:regulator of sirC expression with transglutaminase-like and TPR domain
VPIPFVDSPEFRRLLRRHPGADLTKIALEVARDAYPTLDMARYLAKIEGLADRVRDRCIQGAKLRQILGHINWVLFVEERYRGNTEEYYDCRNSYLNEVIDRRTGNPISLSTLYLAIADRLGLAMSGVNLPAHFVLRTGWGESAVFVDAFHGGILLDREGCETRVREVTGQPIEISEEVLAPCSTAAIVARILRNLKAVYLRSGDFVTSLPVLRRLAALSEGDPFEQRDLGVAALHADRPGEAVDHLQAYLSARPKSADSEAVTTLLRSARRELAARN